MRGPQHGAECSRGSAPARVSPTNGGVAGMLRLQRLAGNAAVAGALTTRPPTVQRQLMLTGSPPDVAKVLTLLQAASGLALHHNDRSKLVTTSGLAGKPTSAALTTHLGLIIGDTTLTAKVSLTRTGAAIFMGSFPEDETKRIQLVRIDHVLALEKGVRGAGVATLAHEFMENYEAQAVPTADWDDAFRRAHKTALQAENTILDELQDAAGAPRSGGRLNTYRVMLSTPGSGRAAAPRQRLVFIATHENDYIVHEYAGTTDAITARRAASTSLGTFTLKGFTNTSSGVPKGSLPTLKRVADILDFNPTAGVVMRATATPRSAPRTARWTTTLTEQIRDLMAGDSEAKSWTRFGTRLATSGTTNEVEIGARRPAST